MQQPLVDNIITAPTTGLSIHYRDWGGSTEQPSVLLLHGLASTCRIYDLCAPLLARGRRVVAYDQRGHGETAKPDDGYDLATLVADGVGLAQALDIPPPYTVAGHSWGASVALKWAVRHPDLVHTAVLIDGGVSSFRDLPGATWQTVEERFAPPAWRDVTLSGLLERTRGGDLRFLDEDFRQAFFTAMTEPLPGGMVRARLSQKNHWSILRGMWEEDYDAAYRALRRPALALLAEPAPPLSEAQREYLTGKQQAAARRQALQPLLQVRWLKETIHDIPLQRPEVLADAIASTS